MLKALVMASLVAASMAASVNIAVPAVDFNGWAAQESKVYGTPVSQKSSIGEMNSLPCQHHSGYPFYIYLPNRTARIHAQVRVASGTGACPSTHTRTRVHWHTQV